MKFIEHNGRLYQYNESQLFSMNPGRYTPVFYDVTDSLYGKIISRQVYGRGGLPKSMYFVLSKNLGYLRISHISGVHPERNKMFIKSCRTYNEWRNCIQEGIGVLESIFDLPKYIIDDYHDNIDSFLELIEADGRPIIRNEDYLSNGFPSKVNCSLRPPSERDKDFCTYIYTNKSKIINGKKSREQTGFIYRKDVDFFSSYEDSFLRGIKRGIISQHDFKVFMEGADEVKNYAQNMLKDVQKAIKIEGFKKEIKHVEAV